jgi:hypothetical protein
VYQVRSLSPVRVMSDDDDLELPIPINLKAIAALAGPDFDEDSKLVLAWLRGGAPPDFASIARRLLSFHQKLAERGLHEPDEDFSNALAELADSLASGNATDLKAAVALVVELTRYLLKGPTPPPAPRGPRGPFAAKMSIGKKKP